MTDTKKTSETMTDNKKTSETVKTKDLIHSEFNMLHNAPKIGINEIVEHSGDEIEHDCGRQQSYECEQTSVIKITDTLAEYFDSKKETLYVRTAYFPAKNCISVGVCDSIIIDVLKATSENANKHYVIRNICDTFEQTIPIETSGTGLEKKGVIGVTFVSPIFSSYGYYANIDFTKHDTVEIKESCISNLLGQCNDSKCKFEHFEYNKYMTLLNKYPSGGSYAWRNGLVEWRSTNPQNKGVICTNGGNWYAINE